MLPNLRHFPGLGTHRRRGGHRRRLQAMGHKNNAVTSDLYGNLFDKASQEMAERAATIVPRQRRPRHDNKTPRHFPGKLPRNDQQFAG